MAQEVELHFTKKPRHRAAPNCACGEVNSPKNPQFAPFEGFEQYGYCHRCDRTFFPEKKDGQEYKIKIPVKLPQKYITDEPVFNWIVPDAIIEPKPVKPMKGKYFITWYYRNIHDKLTGAKKMEYNFHENGFNRTDTHPLHIYNRDSGYYPCLFYERDLYSFPYATVILVESEKTAVVMRKKMLSYLKEFIYLATGGSNGLTNEKAKVLAGRTVLICYDCDNGEPQPDGTIKGPKGREGAHSAHTKLAGIATSSIVDIDPSKNDGTDLADIETDIEFIRKLKGEQKYSQELIDQIRNMNRAGEKWNKDRADAIGTAVMVDHDKVYEIGRVYYETNKHEHGLDEAPMLRRVEYFLLQRFEFRRNSLNRKVFYRDKAVKDSEFVFCNYNDVWRLLQHNIQSFGKKVRISITDVSNLLESDFVQEVNPFHDYFHSLPHWDGRDWITDLANYIKTTDQPFWVQQFRKSLIRMIACTYGNIENRIIMVLVGPTQAQGKDSWIRFLCPPQLREYYKEDPLEASKDTEIALCQNFLWNLTELDQLSKKEISEIKGIISRAQVKQRRSYGRQEENMMRIVSFWGSTNKDEFLTDTQNTRWLCFRVEEINHKYNDYIHKIKEIDITKVWAQAWFLYKSGESFLLDKEESFKQETINHSLEYMSPEKSLIIKFLTPCGAESQGSEFMVNVEVLQYLIAQTDNKLRLVPENVGRAMTQLGFEGGKKKMLGKSVRGYYLLKQPLLNGMKHHQTEPQEQPEIFQSVPGTNGHSKDPDELPF